MTKGLKVNLGKTKVEVSGGITKDGMSKSKVNPCGVCSLWVRINSVLCVQCGRSRNFSCKECEGSIREAVEEEETLCDEV